MVGIWDGEYMLLLLLLLLLKAGKIVMAVWTLVGETNVGHGKVCGRKVCKLVCNCSLANADRANETQHIMDSFTI